MSSQHTSSKPEMHKSGLENERDDSRKPVDTQQALQEKHYTEYGQEFEISHHSEDTKNVPFETKVRLGKSFVALGNSDSAFCQTNFIQSYSLIKDLYFL